MNMFKRKYSKITEIDPNEVLLDSKNLANFNMQQFEGRIEKPISKYTIILLGIFFFVIQISYLSKVGILQIAQGEGLRIRAENNRLDHSVIFGDRGIIYDRNKVPLVWNVLSGNPNDWETATSSEHKDVLNDFALRRYIADPGFSHILGYVSYPAKDKSGNYYSTEYEGRDGVEKIYNKDLNGITGLKIEEVDALSNTRSESVIEPPVSGKDLVLTIDSRVQKQLYKVISDAAISSGFRAGSGVIMDVNSGEILAMTSYPEYSSQVITDGSDKKTISSYQTNKATPFLDRAVSGLYTPGSIVKPFMAIAALDVGVINPSKKILSTGAITIPNPYFPDKPSVFKDWRAHGWVDMRDAIAVSSDVYFYAVGGGYKDQKGIGIANIEKYMRLFGFGSKTGIDVEGEAVGTIPTPEWKKQNFSGADWLLGDTYHTAIGQYGFQVSPLQSAHAVAAIASGGTLVTPHVVVNTTIQKKQIADIPASYFDVASEGMRRSVLFGIAGALNVASVNIAAKTGTAELGVKKDMVNSWIVGFFPYEHPRYAFALVMEHGPVKYTQGAPATMGQMVNWMGIYTPEYFK
jgi:penicillin-binding protein 2